MKGVPVALRPGPAARLRRSEVVALALFGKWCQFPTERAFYRYAVAHLGGALSSYLTPSVEVSGPFRQHVARATIAMLW